MQAERWPLGKILIANSVAIIFWTAGNRGSDSLAVFSQSLARQIALRKHLLGDCGAGAAHDYSHLGEDVSPPPPRGSTLGLSFNKTKIPALAGLTTSWTGTE